MPKLLATLSSPRRRWTADDARNALDALERSGLSMRVFAEAAGIHVQRLVRWRRKLGRSASAVRSKPKSTPISFVEVRQHEADRVEVVLRSGRVLRCTEEISDAVLRRWVGILEEEPEC